MPQVLAIHALLPQILDRLARILRVGWLILQFLGRLPNAAVALESPLAIPVIFNPEQTRLPSRGTVTRAHITHSGLCI